MPLPLSELREFGVGLEWFESVAITQAACAAALADESAGIPDIRDLLLNPDGTVTCTAPGAVGEAGIREAAALLKALLPEAVPVPLRLFALTALSSAPYATLLEFSQALQYFQRPDAREVLRDVYERGKRAAAGPRIVVPLDEGLDALAAFAAEGTSRAAESQGNAGTGRQPTMSSWRGTRLAVATVAPALVVISGGWWFMSSLLAERQPRLRSTPVAAVVSSLVPGVPSKSPLDGRAAKSRGVQALWLEPSSGAAPVRPTPRSPFPQAGSRASLDRATPSRSTATSGVAGADPRLPAEVVYATFCEPSDPTTGRPDEVHVYSAADADITPPVAVRPWFSTEPPPPGHGEYLMLEVLVSGSGDPVSARVFAGARGYRDGMVLSAVKGGKFKPALRGGCPVAYRQTIWVRAR